MYKPAHQQFDQIGADAFLLQVRSVGQVCPTLSVFFGASQPFADRGKVSLESVGRMRASDSSSSGAEHDCSLTKSELRTWEWVQY